MLKLKKNHMKSLPLGMIFKIIPESIILYGSDDSVVVADEQGSFPALDGFLTRTISGDKEPKSPSHNPFGFNFNMIPAQSGMRGMPTKRKRGQRNSHRWQRPNRFHQSLQPQSQKAALFI